MPGIGALSPLLRRLRKINMRKDWRRKKFKEQKGRCFYCGVSMMLEGAAGKQANRCTLDHRLPLSRGGMDHWENSVAACSKCNNAKGSLTEKEFRAVQGISSVAFNSDEGQR